MNKEQQAEQYAQSKTYGMGVYNSDIAKKDFLAGYDAAIRELQAKNSLYSDSEAFRVGYAQALKELGWRKVEDELPAEDTEVATYLRGTMVIGYRIGERWYMHGIAIDTPTHWMPIPSIND